jgi:hypothetical protein
MYSLKMVYFYRNMLEYCLYYLYVFDIVHSVDLINEYTACYSLGFTFHFLNRQMAQLSDTLCVHCPVIPNQGIVYW